MSGILAVALRCMEEAARLNNNTVCHHGPATQGHAPSDEGHGKRGHNCSN